MKKLSKKVKIAIEFLKNLKNNSLTRILDSLSSNKPNIKLSSEEDMIKWWAQNKKDILKKGE